MPDRNSRQKADEPSKAAKLFGDLANRTSQAAGRASTFILALLIVIVWAVTGPVFGFSDTWQLVINTGTTIVTFLMVFLIQNSKNWDSAAIQVNLDELIRAGAARNSFVGIEHLTDEELAELREKYEARARAEKGGEISVRKAGTKPRGLPIELSPSSAVHPEIIERVASSSDAISSKSRGLLRTTKRLNNRTNVQFTGSTGGQ